MSHTSVSPAAASPPPPHASKHADGAAVPLHVETASEHTSQQQHNSTLTVTNESVTDDVIPPTVMNLGTKVSTVSTVSSQAQEAKRHAQEASFQRPQLTLSLACGSPPATRRRSTSTDFRVVRIRSVSIGGSSAAHHCSIGARGGGRRVVNIRARAGRRVVSIIGSRGRVISR
jgi:hypothetical protein